VTLDIEHLAREAGIPCDGAAFGGRTVECLRAYTASVLEEAARVAEQEAVDELATDAPVDRAYNWALKHAAAAIRAMKPK
jgi:hypothetical protein